MDSNQEPLRYRLHTAQYPAVLASGWVITDANSLALKQYGLNLVSMDPRELLSKESRERLEAALKNQKDGGYLCQWRDNEHRFELYIEHNEYLVCIIPLSAEIGSPLPDLMTNIEGQLRNKISTLRMAFENIEDAIAEGNGSRASQNLGVATRGVYALTRLADNLRDMSQSISEDNELSLRYVSISDLCREVCAAANEMSGFKGIKVEFCDYESNVYSKADNYKLKRALYNILLNAIQNSYNDGIIKVTLTLSGDAITIRVRDEGKGFPKGAPSPELFDSFRTFSLTHSSMGLGLGVSSAIVQQHGGAVFVTSNDPMPGVTITINLPLAGDGLITREPEPAYDGAPSQSLVEFSELPANDFMYLNNRKKTGERKKDSCS